MKCPFWNIKWGTQYEVAPFALVASESRLLQKKLALEELLYNASYIPVVWANIHPFYDGNGATNRKNIIIITVTTTAKI